MVGIIDSHAHLCGRELYPKLKKIAKEAKDIGIRKIMIVCGSVEEARRAVAAACEDSMFDVAAGFHPNDALSVSRKDWDELCELLLNPHVKAIGEIGMDYFSYETVVPKVLQKELFIRQMELANEFGKPAIIHMRMAAEDTRRYIKGHLRVPGIMHGYSGGYKYMKDFLDIGMYLSLSGNITFEAGDENTRRAVEEIPLDRLLVESNAPFHTPVPAAGGLNEPKNITYVTDWICRIRGMEQEELLLAVKENYDRIFGR